METFSYPNTFLSFYNYLFPYKIREKELYMDIEKTYEFNSVQFTVTKTPLPNRNNHQLMLNPTFLVIFIRFSIRLIFIS